MIISKIIPNHSGSHKKIEIACDFCTKTAIAEYRHYLHYTNNKTTPYYCLRCSRKHKFMGRKNPNTKYWFNDNLFKNIDTEHKAYLLGWIASDGSINKRGFSISIRKKDKKILTELKNIISPSLVIKERMGFKNKNYKSIDEITDVILTVNSKTMADDLCQLLNINYGKKSHIVNFPYSIPRELYKDFIRGYFDGDGSVNIRNSHSYPRASIASNSKKMLEGINQIIPIKGKIYKNALEWEGNFAIDFLYYIYNNASIKLERKYELYHRCALWIPSLRGKSFKDEFIKVNRCHKNGVLPSKKRATDSGYDLTLIEKDKSYGPVTLYKTGVKVSPNFGYYMMVVPRSSIIKSGYMLANNIAIIDRTYIGEILIPLIKVDPLAEDLKLPNTCMQMIPTPIVHLDILEVDSLEETNRGDGGFGSTNQKP